MLLVLIACAKTPAPAEAPAAPAPVPTPAVSAPAPAPAVGGTLTLRLDAGAGFTGIEVTCPSGYRQRAGFVDGIATLEGLPSESCVVNFKGGPPARYEPLSAGSWQCRFAGSTMSCTSAR